MYTSMYYNNVPILMYPESRTDIIWNNKFYFILFYFILFYFILFYFILFYFILFYFILFYFICFT